MQTLSKQRADVNTLPLGMELVFVTNEVEQAFDHALTEATRSSRHSERIMQPHC